jgi:hypothetical protein
MVCLGSEVLLLGWVLLWLLLVVLWLGWLVVAWRRGEEGVVVVVVVWHLVLVLWLLFGIIVRKSERK